MLNLLFILDNIIIYLVVNFMGVFWCMYIMIEIVDVNDFFMGFLFLNFIWCDFVMEILYLGVMEVWEFINFMFDVYFMYIYFIKFKVLNI